MTTYTNHAAAITDKLIAAINHNPTGQWSAPWHHNGTAIWAPINATTGSHYRASNIITLAIEALTHGYTSGQWATYRQWQTTGNQVRKNETGTRCLRWVNTSTQPPKPETDHDTEEADESRTLVPKTFVVFNADQLDNVASQPVAPDTPASIDEAETDIAATGATIHHQGNHAFYQPALDHIQVPPRHQFTSTAGYYSTILHELTHWTGHPSRLNRNYSKHFGDHAYAIEELTAELGAAILTARYHITNQARQDHANYLNHWLHILDQHPTTLHTTATQAQKAVDHILTPNPNQAVPLSQHDEIDPEADPANHQASA